MRIKPGPAAFLTLLLASIVPTGAFAAQPAPAPAGPAAAPAATAPVASDPHRLTEPEARPDFDARAPLSSSVPLSDNLDIGLGIYSIAGARVREREFRRSDPIRDVSPQPTKAAAVGLRLRF